MDIACLHSGHDGVACQIGKVLYLRQLTRCTHCNLLRRYPILQLYCPLSRRHGATPLMNRPRMWYCSQCS